jgi:hypothetical protein
MQCALLLCSEALVCPAANVSRSAARGDDCRESWQSAVCSGGARSNIELLTSSQVAAAARSHRLHISTRLSHLSPSLGGLHRALAVRSCALTPIDRPVTMSISQLCML